MKNVMYFVLVAGLAWAGCSSPAAPAAVATPDVYLLGVQISTNTPGWWKNGVFTAVPLGSGQGSRSVAVLQVVSGDFYDASIGTHVMKLWTDGTTAAAADWVRQGNGSTEGGFGAGLAVRGNDTLFAATESQGSTQNAVLWTNGVPVALSTSGKATAYGLVVQGADAYVGGLQSGTVSVWKNGVRQALGTVVGQSDATCVAARGTDLYIGGQSLDGIGGYWLNGVFQAVPDCGAVYDIAVL